MNGPSRIESFRADARRLLKRLRAGGEGARPAARRFRQLRSLADHSVEALMAGEVRVRLKHALAVIATEAGYGSWLDLKQAAADGMPPMHVRAMDVLLNAWFSDYADARAARDRHGGYLLPFRSQFFVCEEEGIRLLGLDPDDPDWRRIGYDWVRPADRAAHHRLLTRRLDAIRAEPRGTTS